LLRNDNPAADAEAIVEGVPGLPFAVTSFQALDGRAVDVVVASQQEEATSDNNSSARLGTALLAAGFVKEQRALDAGTILQQQCIVGVVTRCDGVNDPGHPVLPPDRRLAGAR